MIKLRERDKDLIDDWYVGCVTKRVQENIQKNFFDKIEQNIQESRQFLEDVLALKKKPKYTLQKENVGGLHITWARGRTQVTVYLSKEEITKVVRLIEELIELLYDDKFLRILLVESEEKVTEYVKDKEQVSEYIKDTHALYKKENIHDTNKLKVMNSIVELFIYYELLDSEQKEIKLKQELYGKLNIRACPYCNRQFIDPIAIKNEENEEIEKRYNTGDLDHILPKSQYPLYAVSLWNLTPCCKTCNETFKSSDESPILNPWEDGFGDRVELTLYPENNESILNIFFGDTENFSVRWKVLQSKNSQSQDTESNNNQSTQKITKEDKIKNAITMFRLNELYTTHRSEIRKLLATQQKYPEVYDIFLSRFDNGATEKTKPIEEEDYQTMVLARLTHDIHKMNFEIDMLNNPELRDTEPKGAEDSDTE